ncbi:predicted protein [Coccidioides posadasii str. Silveira]|uniref:Predicted protein n=1 Tax=Coccidioides posadasii (strain RMSCC 757 / Silveira) TaxID=443226 RepID=E9D569_COCPS|nr:predicted protein [Coccidioides posadasii str. Silveira]
MTPRAGPERSEKKGGRLALSVMEKSTQLLVPRASARSASGRQKQRTPLPRERRGDRTIRGTGENELARRWVGEPGSQGARERTTEVGGAPDEEGGMRLG